MKSNLVSNESSFWSGRPHNYDNPEAFQYFSQIRDLVFAHVTVKPGKAARLDDKLAMIN